MTTFDLAVVGAPFLDLTFAGLPRLPSRDEEVVARELRVGPGGTGMQSVGAARLGLSVALVSPVGEDPAGEVLRSMLAAEGVTWIGSPHGSTPTTAILSTPAGAAMATAFGDDEPTADDVAAVDARAVALSLGRLPLRPSKAAVYATTGGIELDAGVRIDNVSLDGVRAVILNEGEATRLTNTDEAPVAARKLAEHVACAVVTLGARGAVAVENGREVRAVAPDIEVVDATGAGDLFIPAYVWADLRGVDVETRVAWASLYAGLSVRAPTAFEGAVTIGELLAEGSRRELPEPV